jgi:hypothetical protein
MSLFNTLFAVLLAFGIACLTKGKLVSLYELVSDDKLLMQSIIVVLCATITMYAMEQWRKQRKYIKAALTMRRRAPGLRQHMIEGVQGGTFAYLAKQVQYGTEGEGSWLPPMAEVYVICNMDEVENDPTREPTMLVVPVFKDVSLTRPTIAVQVPRSDLFKHIPRNMIPELI